MLLIIDGRRRFDHHHHQQQQQQQHHHHRLWMLQQPFRSCLVEVLNFGMRNGGGIGDSLHVYNAYTQTYHWIFHSLYDWSFFIVINGACIAAAAAAAAAATASVRARLFCACSFFFPGRALARCPRSCVVRGRSIWCCTAAQSGGPPALPRCCSLADCPTH